MLEMPKWMKTRGEGRERRGEGELGGGCGGGGGDVGGVGPHASVQGGADGQRGGAFARGDLRRAVVVGGAGAAGELQPTKSSSYEERTPSRW